MKLRVTVADANRDFLTHIVSLLQSEFEVIATATDGESALKLICKHRPDVAVLDLRLPGINGMEIMKQTGNCGSRPSFVMCTIENDPDFVDAASRAGARGYVLKNRIATDLIAAVKAVAAGDCFVSV